ncbi:ATP-binding protein [Actinospica sp. MGRD01-02]|uniref:ATP-binding protein n=1 Tax=Actinospica acidithermotolerans TaxID=2828514 RepID=A0A941IK64_9ACTN|nr:ATP-binding protein [Actinospica acidithermotolerans]MBR7828612.1 ATP-binding protein [Actinospica acidithermotolerans]
MPAVRVAPTTYEANLPHSSVSVRQARARLAQDLSERDVLGTVVDDAVLILSEFVTNSLRHARALNSDTIRVSWSLSGEGVLRIEVTDGGGTTRPVTKPYAMSVSAQAGRGLEIVDRLADRWGSQREESGDEYTVWAELAVRARHAGRRGRTRNSARTGQSGGATVTALPAHPQSQQSGGERPGSGPNSSRGPSAQVIPFLPSFPNHA